MSAPSNPNDDGGIDRREFIGAAAVMTGAALTAEARAAQAAKEGSPKRRKQSSPKKRP